MKKLFAAAFATVIFLTACNNGATDKAGADKKENAATASAGDNNVITFKVDGKLIISAGWNINRFDFNGGVGTCLNVTSDMHQQPATINININGDKAGTYKLAEGMDALKTPGVAYGGYKPDYLNDMGNTYTFQNGEFTIISIDDKAGTLNATFNGNAKNGEGKTVSITEGKVINGTLKPGITKTP